MIRPINREGEGEGDRESRPSDLTLKDLIRIFSSILSNHLPDQTQLDKILRNLIKILSSDSQPTKADKHVSSNGKICDRDYQGDVPEIVRVSCNLLESIRVLTLDRNKKNQIQNLIYKLFYEPSDDESGKDSNKEEEGETLKKKILKSYDSISAQLSSVASIISELLIQRSSSFISRILSESIDLIGSLINLIIFNNDDDNDSGETNGNQNKTKKELMEDEIDQFISRLIVIAVEIRRRFYEDDCHSIALVLKDLRETFSEGSDPHLKDKFYSDLDSSFGVENLVLVFDVIVQLAGQDESVGSILSDLRSSLEILKTQSTEIYRSEIVQILTILENLFKDFESFIYSPRLYSSIKFQIDKIIARKSLIDEQLKHLLVRLMKSLKSLNRDLEEDELNQNFLRALREFFEEVSKFEGLGKGFGAFFDRRKDDLKEFSEALWRDLINYLIPKLLSLIDEIPLPRIEYVSEKFDAVIDPLSLRSTSGFLPDSLTSISINKFQLSSKTKNVAKNRNNLTKQILNVDGLRLRSRDVKFYFKNKTVKDENQFKIVKKLKENVLEFEDEGYFDVFIGMNDDDGIRIESEFDLSLSNRNSEDDDLLNLVRLDVSLQGFGIFPHDSNHSIVNWILKPSFEPVLKLKLESILKQILIERVEEVKKFLRILRFTISQSSHIKENDDDYHDRSRMEGEFEKGVLDLMVETVGFMKRFYKHLKDSEDGRTDKDQEKSIDEGGGKGLNRKSLWSDGILIEDQDYKIFIGCRPKLLKKEDEIEGGFKDRIQKRLKEEVIDEVLEDGHRKVFHQVNQGLEQIRLGFQESQDLCGGDENFERWRSDAFDF